MELIYFVWNMGTVKNETKTKLCLEENWYENDTRKILKEICKNFKEKKSHVKIDDFCIYVHALKAAMHYTFQEGDNTEDYSVQ